MLVQPNEQDGGSVSSLDLNSFVTDDQEPYGSHVTPIGIVRPNVYSPPVTNSSDGYISMTESAANDQGNFDAKIVCFEDTSKFIIKLTTQINTVYW